MLEQTRNDRKDEIELEMGVQMIMVTSCHNCYFRNSRSYLLSSMVNHAKSDVLKVREMDRKERNDALKAEWVKDVKRWEVERDSAKFDRRKARWTKPKMPAMEKGDPKPKVADFAGDEGIDEERDEEGFDRILEDSDSDSD
jgi:hypothetical protein